MTFNDWYAMKPNQTKLLTFSRFMDPFFKSIYNFWLYFFWVKI